MEQSKERKKWERRGTVVFKEKDKKRLSADFEVTTLVGPEQMDVKKVACIRQQKDGFRVQAGRNEPLLQNTVKEVKKKRIGRSLKKNS